MLKVVCTSSGKWDLQFRGKRATPKPQFFGSWTSSLFGVRPSSRAATAPGGYIGHDSVSRFQPGRLLGAGARKDFSSTIRSQTSMKWSSSFLLDGGALANLILTSMATVAREENIGVLITEVENPLCPCGQIFQARRLW